MSKEDLHKDSPYIIHPKKMLIWMVMVSVVMLFAGFTSYLIARKAEGGWVNITLPSNFIYSTIVIVISSITLHTGQILFKKNISLNKFIFPIITLVLGGVFMYYQKLSWWEIFKSGYPFGFDGSDSSVSIIYVLVWVHIAHIVIAMGYLCSLLFVLGFPRFTDDVTRRYENVTLFWHFLGILWIYLYIFMIYNYQ